MRLGIKGIGNSKKKKKKEEKIKRWSMVPKEIYKVV